MFYPAHNNCCHIINTCGSIGTLNKAEDGILGSMCRFECIVELLLVFCTSKALNFSCKFDPPFILHFPSLLLEPTLEYCQIFLCCWVGAYKYCLVKPFFLDEKLIDVCLLSIKPPT